MVLMLHPHNKRNPTPQFPHRGAAFIGGGNSMWILLSLLIRLWQMSSCFSSGYFMLTRIKTQRKCPKPLVLWTVCWFHILLEFCRIVIRSRRRPKRINPTISQVMLIAAFKHHPDRLGLMTFWRARGDSECIYLWGCVTQTMKMLQSAH